MAEPVDPKGHSRKAQASSLSPFEWAFEREKGAEPVSAGRYAAIKQEEDNWTRWPPPAWL